MIFKIWQYLLLIAIILVAFPLGLFLAKITIEQLKAAIIAFKILIIISLLALFISFFLNMQYKDKLILIITMLFIIIISTISLKKSYKARRKK